MTEIVLGFSVRPGLFYRRAFQEAAKDAGLRVKFCDLSGINPVRWEKLDALVLPGGPDIDPCYYMNIVDENLKAHTVRNKNLSHGTKKGKIRDAFEHGLLMEIFHNRALSKLPVLGICRGMQMIAVSQGIPLYLDLRLETGMINTRLEYIPVEVVSGSRFHQIVGEEEFRAFKFQHQGIRMPYFNEHKEKWPRIEISAVSHNGRMAEAIEFSDRPVMGVQFHAELTLHSSARKVFGWLLGEAQRRSEERNLILYQEYAY